ncbi:class I SAM-dependent methyltransferase [Hippea jasoniae]|uniref:class I SAM-dependent methyltransferase n=1 Tax=Hippea jasoniae TaxID=944479 RepID=UPI00054CEBB7|nr:class I SAM-dependent methyltransferase [Hippea jasoniae]
MGRFLNIVNKLHKRTKRDYISRMIDNKVECMIEARKYDKNFWDGDRRYGYGGYKYDGRWQIVAKDLIEEYDLKDGCRILDVGCGKGFLLYELKKLLPSAEVAGFDISKYAIDNAKEEIRDNLFVYDAADVYPFGDNEFDLVISITTLHNLKIYDLKTALEEIERVGKNKYIVVESYRNERELFNLQCWALTCECFFRPDEWIWLYKEFGYSGDYEFIYFE